MLTLARCFSQVQLFVIPKTAARQAPLSVRSSWQEYWRGHHILLQEISTQAWKPKFMWLVHLQADSLPLILTYIFPTISIPLQFNTCNSDIALLQYSCFENPMDRGAWWAAVHGVSKSQIRLSDLTFTFHFHALEKEMATHSSVLAWRIPGMGEPGGLPSMGLHRVGHH